MAYCVILGNGFEDIEAISIIDILRRAGIELRILGINEKLITSRSNVVYQAEQVFLNKDDIEVNSFEGILLPGGPGVEKLAENKALLEVIKTFAKQGKLIFAICAAPLLLDRAGILTNQEYTCYPGTPIKNGKFIDKNVVVAGNIITSPGVGTALEAALKLVEIIVSKEEAQRQAEKILYKY